MGKSLAKKEEAEAREDRLSEAIGRDDVDELHNLIWEERELLDRVSKHPFPKTPLHEAAATGKTLVAMEMAILKPSFTRKLNPDGYSPMHLALQQEHYHTVRALMNLEPKLIRVRGRCGITPLHYVARKEGDNELELLAEFLCSCKSSIEDLTSRCETAVHVAVTNNNIKAVKVLVGWLKRVNLIEILNWKDQDGNTVLQIAESERQHEIIQLFTGEHGTVWKIFLDFLEWFFRKFPELVPTSNLSLSQLLSVDLTAFEKFSFVFGIQDESARKIILVVATLIATTTYQAALSPPGGYWQDNSSNTPANSTVVAANSRGVAVEKPHQAGNIIMSGSQLYLFANLNTLVFTFSIVTIWFAALPLLPHTMMVYMLVSLVGMAYLSALFVEFPKSDVAEGFVTTIAYEIFLFLALVCPVLWWTADFIRRQRIGAAGRRVGDLLRLNDRK